MSPACFEKFIFSHVFNVIKTKDTTKFDGLELRREIKGTVAPEIKTMKRQRVTSLENITRKPKRTILRGLLSHEAGLKASLHLVSYSSVLYRVSYLVIRGS